MFRRILPFLATLVLLTLHVTAYAQAIQRVVLTYTGNNFTIVTGSGPLTKSNHVTVSLTYDVTENSITPFTPLKAWSISDGVHTVSNDGSLDIQLYADVSQNSVKIIYWDISVYPNNLQSQLHINTNGIPGVAPGMDESDFNYPNGGNTAVAYGAGTWSATVGSTPPPITITTTSLPDAISGQPYSTTLAATGGQGTIKWSLASGSTLPTGFSLSSSGVLSSTGNPAATPSTYTFTVVATDGTTTKTQPLSLTVLPNLTVRIDAAQMSNSHTLEVDVTATFSNTTSTAKSIAISLDLNGKHLDKTIDSSLLSTFSVAGTIVHPFFIDLAKDGVPRFKSNQEFSVTATANEAGAVKTVNEYAAILLPVVLVPGIDPFQSKPQGGDGTFPLMESYLMQHSQAQLDAFDILGDGYSNVFPYRTLYTLSYDRNNASLAQGRQALSDLWDSIKTFTYADSVSLVAHSKGGLVARLFVVSQPLAVNRLFMCTTPNLGSVWAKLDTFSSANWSDLYPTYKWTRRNILSPYLTGPNDELNYLNKQVLPPYTLYTILYSKILPTPTTYTQTDIFLYPPSFLPSIPAKILKPIISFVLRLNWTDGDGIVPVFSQLGNNYDPDKPLTTRIPAFVGVPLDAQEIDHTHSEYFENEDVQYAILSRLLSDLK